MTTEFRCTKCGKLLTIDAASRKTQCPVCRAWVEVPAALAALPHPIVPTLAAPPGMGNAAPAHTAERPANGEPAMGLLAKTFPWVLSLCFHAGVLLILAFIFMLVQNPIATHGDVTPPMMGIPIAQQPFNPESTSGGKSTLKDRPKGLGPLEWGWSGDRLTDRPFDRPGVAFSPEAKIGDGPAGTNGKTVRMIGLPGTGPNLGGKGGSGSPDGDTLFGMRGGGAGGGLFFGIHAPDGDGIGPPGSPAHVIYLIDRSGSMLDTFDEVRKEMIRSISRLAAGHAFHVIFYAEGSPKESPPRRLVYATEDNKREAVTYLKTIQPIGQTDPIPALKRAFETFSAAPDKRLRVLYLLTDGEFPDSQAVLKMIKELNADRSVRINTILHHHKSPEAMRVLRQIAQENGGVFRYVEPNE